MKYLLMISFICLSAAVASNAPRQQGAASTQEWNFTVQLDGRPIGWHRFALEGTGAERTLLSQARFDVRILFINAYSYEHTAREVWRGECVDQLVARTDDNGDEIVVNGRRAADRFIVVRDAARRELGSCIQTFAYWNPGILSATHLLNPQTGEYVAVTIAELGRETIDAGGRPQQATRYRLAGRTAGGDAMEIDLWYSDARHWVALESMTHGGRRLRYTLQ